ncbi:MAG: zinc-ribbon domain-containing protein [Clostridiales bacterium]|nr:zinc-ribbon domain-containing protein [Clostridiales bacterium]
MYCTNCGEKNDDRAKFCMSCGDQFNMSLETSDNSNIMIRDEYEKKEKMKLDEKAYKKFKRRERYFMRMKKWSWLGSIILTSLMYLIFFSTNGATQFEDVMGSGATAIVLYSILYIILVALYSYIVAAGISAWHMAKGLFIGVGVIGAFVSYSDESFMVSLMIFIMTIAIGITFMCYAMVPYYILMKYLHKKDLKTYGFA